MTVNPEDMVIMPLEDWRAICKKCCIGLGRNIPIDH